MLAAAAAQGVGSTVASTVGSTLRSTGGSAQCTLTAARGPVVPGAVEDLLLREGAVLARRHVPHALHGAGGGKRLRARCTMNTQNFPGGCKVFVLLRTFMCCRGHGAPGTGQHVLPSAHGPSSGTGSTSSHSASRSTEPETPKSSRIKNHTSQTTRTHEARAAHALVLNARVRPRAAPVHCLGQLAVGQGTLELAQRLVAVWLLCAFDQ